MKHLKKFDQLNEDLAPEGKGDYAVIFDGTSAFVCDPSEIEDDWEVIAYFDDIDDAQEKADEVNDEAYRR